MLKCVLLCADPMVDGYARHCSHQSSRRHFDLTFATSLRGQCKPIAKDVIWPAQYILNAG